MGSDFTLTLEENFLTPMICWIEKKSERPLNDYVPPQFRRDLRKTSTVRAVAPTHYYWNGPSRPERNAMASFGATGWNTTRAHCGMVSQAIIILSYSARPRRPSLDAVLARSTKLSQAQLALPQLLGGLDLVWRHLVWYSTKS